MVTRIFTLFALVAMTALPARADDVPPEARQDVLESVLRDKYFCLGGWRIGMKRDEAAAHFANLEAIDADKVFRGVTQAHFAADLPAEVHFARNRLQTVKLLVYEGADFEQALQRMQQLLLFMDANFVGANFEGGLKTRMDRDGALLRKTLAHTLESLDKGASAADEKPKASGDLNTGFTAYELVMNFWTEHVADNNFLLGEFRYRSDTRTYSVSIFDDRKFVKSRIPHAPVTLFRAVGERPAPEVVPTPGSD